MPARCAARVALRRWRSEAGARIDYDGGAYDRPEFASKPKPFTLPRDATVAAAVARMSELNYGSVIVVDEEHRVEGLVTERDVMKRLVNQGRDPATISLTAGVFVGFPHLLETGRERPPATAMQGRPDEVSPMLAAYREHGIDHLIVHVWPRTPEAVAELGQAAAGAREILSGTRAVAQ